MKLYAKVKGSKESWGEGELLYLVQSAQYGHRPFRLCFRRYRREELAFYVMADSGELIRLDGDEEREA